MKFYLFLMILCSFILPNDSEVDATTIFVALTTIMMLYMAILVKFWYGVVLAIHYGVHVNGHHAKVIGTQPRWVVLQKILALSTTHFLMTRGQEGLQKILALSTTHFLMTRGQERLIAGASSNSLSLILWWSVAILTVRKCRVGLGIIPIDVRRSS